MPAIGGFSIYDSFLENVLHIINKHLSDDSFNVEILSKEVGLGMRNLQRKIKSITNKTPGRLITSIRLNKAKELLMIHNYTVSEIAFQIGFSNPSYFSMCFKKEFGICPTEIRKKRKNLSL